jgi:hypothetical protein
MTTVRSMELNTLSSSEASRGQRPFLPSAGSWRFPRRSDATCRLSSASSSPSSSASNQIPSHEAQRSTATPSIADSRSVSVLHLGHFIFEPSTLPNRHYRKRYSNRPRRSRGLSHRVSFGHQRKVCPSSQGAPALAPSRVVARPSPIPPDPLPHPLIWLYKSFRVALPCKRRFP